MNINQLFSACLAGSKFIYVYILVCKLQVHNLLHFSDNLISIYITQLWFQNLVIYFSCTWSNPMVMKGSYLTAWNLFFLLHNTKYNIRLIIIVSIIAAVSVSGLSNQHLAFISQQNVILLLLLMDVHIFSRYCIFFCRFCIGSFISLLHCWCFFLLSVSYFWLHPNLLYYLWTLHFKKAVIYFLAKILDKWTSIWFQKEQNIRYKPG